jgi:hypothetical protein
VTIHLDKPDPLAARKEAAHGRVSAALDLIEHAQRLLDRAAQELCDVGGMAPEWRRIGAVHGAVTRAWYAVRGKADRLALTGRLLLDHEPRQVPAERVTR